MEILRAVILLGRFRKLPIAAMSIVGLPENCESFLIQNPWTPKLSFNLMIDICHYIDPIQPKISMDLGGKIKIKFIYQQNRTRDGQNMDIQNLVPKLTQGGIFIRSISKLVLELEDRNKECYDKQSKSKQTKFNKCLPRNKKIK